MVERGALPDPAAFAAEWVAAWNAHDLDRLLAHFAADVVFTSPRGAQLIPGSDGVFEGIDALRDYWTRGLELIPDLHFELVNRFDGIDTIVIAYRNQAGGLVSEFLRFGPDALVHEGHGTYRAA